MRKNILLSILFLLLLTMFGCTSGKKVKYYEDTEENNVSHTEVSITAVIFKINPEQDIVQIKDCRTGVEHSLLYHGGVRVTNSHGREVSLSDLGVGSVVDVVYYEDTAKIVTLAENKSSSKISNVKKFSANKNTKKAMYKGISCNMSENAIAINHDGRVLDVSEVNTEDKVTLHMYGSKLVAVVIDEGHGYVRLKNQDTYIGGMVEIGYDVIVPVSSNMLMAVREGIYTLRISNNGYSQSKQIQVKKDTETLVDLGDIAIPDGTAVFEVDPADATIYIDGKKISGYTYTDIYGTYSVRVEAEGYKTYKGSFKISDTVKSYTVNLTKLEEDTTEDTTETTSETTTETTEISTTESDDTTEHTTEDVNTPGDAVTETTAETTDSTTIDSSIDVTDETSAEDVEGNISTEEGIETDNIITINTPALAGVYVDGDYVGVAPISFKKVTGTHTVTLYRSGYLIKSYTIQAENDGKDDVYNFADLTTLLDLIE